MKRRFLATATRSGISIIFLVYSALAYCGEDAFAKWAAAHALPITTLDFAGNDSDLLPLESAIGAARVVAFGEPTHGVHEPLAFRNRLFRFLVERMGFTAIALESGFTESIGARSFIEGGEGDAETAARTGLSIGANLLDVARQLAKCLPLTPSAPPAKVGISAWAPTMTCRDSAMAENVQWALENEGRQGRLLIFAHNGHVMNTKDDGRRWANVREKPPMMGLHLRRVYGKDLYIIAMSSATASGGLPSKPIEEDSIDSALVGLDLPLMFLDVRTGRQNKDVLTWLSTRRSLNANVSAQSLITPSTAVDAFFFVNTLTPAILSSDKAP